MSFVATLILTPHFDGCTLAIGWLGCGAPLGIFIDCVVGHRPPLSVFHDFSVFSFYSRGCDLWHAIGVPCLTIFRDDVLIDLIWDTCLASELATTNGRDLPGVIGHDVIELLGARSPRPRCPLRCSVFAVCDHCCRLACHAFIV